MEIATSRALQDKLYDKRKGGALEYVTPYLCIGPPLGESHQEANIYLGRTRSSYAAHMADGYLPWLLLV
jgi:hypothetical protein